MDIRTALLTYDKISTELYHLGCIGALLGWDQQVYMPQRAAAGRAKQNELVESYSHRLTTSDELREAVDYLYENIDQLSDSDAVNIRESQRALVRARKLPEQFVAETARTFSEGYSIWVTARPADDFEAVKDVLKRIVDLWRKEADLVGYEKDPYDAQIDKYEPYATIGFIKPLLLELGQYLSECLNRVPHNFKSTQQLSGHYPAAVQERLMHKIVSDLGYSFTTGRIDATAHPFMTSVGINDFRITTHYYEEDFTNALYSVIHETGHALYEMGLDKSQAGKPMGMPVSMGIHESQSRFWENIIGRSKEFCLYFERAASDWLEVPSNFWELVNTVKPSLIRIEADELTYSLHIIIRMLLEEELMAGEISVDELPYAWNDLYKKYLGVSSETYKDGVMQDVHWFSGAIGYFPSYALGNLYNCAMFAKMQQDIPNLSENIVSGEYSAILYWLRTNVHRHGQHYNARELITRITGSDLHIEPFVSYIRNKYGC